MFGTSGGIYPELALNGLDGARTDTVFFLISQVCTSGLTLYTSGLNCEGVRTFQILDDKSRSIQLFSYIALQGTTKVHLPHKKFGETLNLRLFGVGF